MAKSLSTRMAIAFSIAVRYLMLLAQFGSTMVLARLLTPHEIGVYSAGYTVVALAYLFRDFGLNQYLIQEQNLNEEKVTSAFTLTVIISWSLGLLVYCLGEPAAIFFDQPGIASLIHLLSINFILIPFGSITIALLRKQLKFEITAGISAVSALLGIVVSIATALQGASYFCIAYGAIAETICTVVLSLFFRNRNYKLRLGLKGSKQILKFGSMVGAGNVIQHFSLSVIDAVIARILGMGALGFYSRAYGTFSLFDRLFTGSINPIILPLFSHANQDQNRLQAGYIKAVDYSIIFAWPFFCFLYLFTSDVVLLLYGPQWETAVPLVKVLCIGGLLLPPALFSDNLFIAIGRPEITLNIRIISNVVQLLLVAFAVQFGLKAICFAVVTFYACRLLLTLFYLRKTLSMGAHQFGKIVLRTLPCVVFTVVPALLLNESLKDNDNSLFLNMTFMGLLSLSGWLLGLFIGKHPFCTEISAILCKLNIMRPGKPPKASEQ
ncbi:MAG: lipopolysaccharide biosynthesis protein [Parahaliea sp.]